MKEIKTKLFELSGKREKEEEEYSFSCTHYFLIGEIERETALSVFRMVRPRG